MNCTEAKTYLINFSELTFDQEHTLRQHATNCAQCREELEIITLQQSVVNRVKAVLVEPPHATALTHKIMRSLPTQSSKHEFWILNPLRMVYGVSSILLLFFLGWELVREPTFPISATQNGPKLYSSNYITKPLQPHTKPIGLVARIKTKGYDIN